MVFELGEGEGVCVRFDDIYVFWGAAVDDGYSIRVCLALIASNWFMQRKYPEYVVPKSTPTMMRSSFCSSATPLGVVGVAAPFVPLRWGSELDPLT